MNMSQLEDLIFEYHWRKKESDRIGDILFGINHAKKSVGVAQYGIEATLPKPNTNIKSISEMDDMDAREKRQYERWIKITEKVEAVEILTDYLTNEQHQIILDCMMEGKSYRSISVHLNMNRNKLRDMKEEMLYHLCQKCQFLHLLKEKKEIVYN